ncbi:right-handed parallel beta-helix repeat-containing protein [Paenibacillus sp. MWE-103]|uniref:Right-handed parallel beta-helix repeat-containing protein n=1 Tax=Paenibacillus artemisiicola TaxID=1172618 RepID=A0ABS3W9D1_9BACL|nr:right-handed parallel beta-helix repeat-containing protein [Paenibacillus artemisiicola]MBO7744882.1 right-handed parallel beta-helix repeat-containing protein [Paenibacillus artemisiicola]
METAYEVTGGIARFRLTDYGAEPDSGRDALPAMRRAIEAAGKHDGPALLEIPQGRYDFYPDEAAREPYYITNTASEEENPDVTKTIAILLKGIERLTLDGQGSLFLFHGRVTMLALDGCDDVEIRNLHLDYARPTVAEMTVTAAGTDYMDVEVHPDSRYEVQDGKVHWTGDGWRFNAGPMQAFDPVRNRTWRIDNLGEAALAEELAPMRLRFRLGGAPSEPAGRVLQVRDGLRDQVGVFIRRSRNIRFADGGIHFMHGLGVVCQYSEDLRFAELDFSPRPETGRTVTAFADFIHVSGCRGRVEIEGCRFVGGHDDPINVHGTHLQLVGMPEANRVLLRFMHPQTYGFQAFFPGDEIAFVKRETLLPYASGKVLAVEAVSPRDWLLTLDADAPAGAEPGDAVENVTWNPELRVRGNYFARIPTRGVLVTTRRKTVIEDNVFDGTTMSGVFVADDAESWFESGPVRDLTIRGNRFAACGSSEHPVIFIAPENRVADAARPVHEGIVIEGNRIETSLAAALVAKSVRGLRFANNEVVPAEGAAEDGAPAAASLIRLDACSGAAIEGNAFAEGGMPANVAALKRMAPDGLRMGEGQRLRVEARD